MVVSSWGVEGGRLAAEAQMRFGGWGLLCADHRDFSRLGQRRRRVVALIDRAAGIGGGPDLDRVVHGWQGVPTGLAAGSISI